MKQVVIDSPDCIKKKNRKTTKLTAKNPINKKYNKCFQYTEIINYLTEKDDWKKIEKNNLTTALNVLYAGREKNISCLGFKT